jgi:hypothetical protein
MPVRIDSPYDQNSGDWLKGNLHAHTTHSDGAQSPEELLSIYQRLGYDWICISDHDTVTPRPDRRPEGLAFLSGNEVTARGPHLLYIGASDLVAPDPDRPKVVSEILARNGLCILNHPNWGFEFLHWPQELLESIPGYHGIEIYNGIVRRLEGSSLATDRWDRLLSKGKRVWGFANDDAHLESDCGIAWNVVRCEKGDPGPIIESLKSGRFYASTGVSLSALETGGGKIRMISTNGSCCVVVMDHGVELGRYPGRSWQFDLERLAGSWRPSYFRFEILGDSGATAWTQPIFLEWT